jgi:hypothetical protein
MSHHSDIILYGKGHQPYYDGMPVPGLCQLQSGYKYGVLMLQIPLRSFAAQKDNQGSLPYFMNL